MNNKPEDTPPSSLDGDGSDMEDDGIYLYEEVKEVNLDDGDIMDDEEDSDDMDTDKEPPEDHSALVFDKHKDSVLRCDIHPDGKIAVTGGVDDKAYVWSVETGQVVMECTGHKDSVEFVGFSFDGAYVATGDLAGSIKVWKVNTEENQQQPWPVVFEYEAEEICWGQWHFGARVLMVGLDMGDIYVFNIPSGEMKILKGQFEDKPECVKLFSDGVRLVVGYEKGGVKIWDLKKNSVVYQIPANVHNCAVPAVDIHPDGNLVASISVNGKLVLLTANNSKIVDQIETGLAELECLAFSKDLPGYVALGTLKGAIGIWDAARQMVRHKCCEENIQEGVSHLIWIKDHLVAGLVDGSLRIFEGRSGAPVKTLTGHRSTILDMCYNAKQNIILTTSDDGTSRVFKYDINDGKS